MIFNALIIAVSLLCSTNDLHKHYVSISEMEWNAKEKQLEASTQVTGHDLEYAINKMYDSHIKLPKVSTDPKDSVLILTELYLKKHVVLTIKEQEYEPKVIGVEQQNDGNAYIYFTFTNIKKGSSITLKNSLLMDYFPEQQNITHVNKEAIRKTRTFTTRNKKQTIDF